MPRRDDDTPAVKLFRGRVQDLAGQHQQQTARNLGYMAVALAIYTFIGYLSAVLPEEASLYIHPDQVRMIGWMTAVFGLLSAVMFILTRMKLPPQLKLDIGLLYQVLGALLWSLQGVYARNPGAGISLDSVSYVILWVTVFPLMAPNKFWRSFVANVLASCTLYMAYGILVAFDATGIAIKNVAFHAGPVVTIALLTMIPVYFLNKLSKDLERAEKMGSYELVGKIGEGGMGEVWEARHNLLAHSTAIKLIKPGVLARSSGSGDTDADVFIRRFEREARATAALRSPNTVDLYDFGVTENGTCYYVMEMLSGMDLGSLVDRYGPVEPRRAVHLLRQACYSLTEAHDNGMVHRDIKPANLFVCRMKPHHDVIKVLDFGLVKQTVLKADETKLTTAGVITGTPAYLSPEQARGEEDIDGRTDIYSLGCVAYWLLTGCDVYSGDTPMKIILAHVGEAPVPPSRRTELDIPASLDEAVLSCLEKEPGKRPQSARELESLLAKIGSDESWNPADAEGWWNTHVPEGSG